MMEGGKSADYTNCCSVHAESNCVARADFSRIQGGSAYVSGVCCATCARLLSNCGITTVYMLDDSTDYRPAEPILELFKTCKIDAYLVRHHVVTAADIVPDPDSGVHYLYVS